MDPLNTEVNCDNCFDSCPHSFESGNLCRFSSVLSKSHEMCVQGSRRTPISSLFSSLQRSANNMFAILCDIICKKLFDLLSSQEKTWPQGISISLAPLCAGGLLASPRSLRRTLFFCVPFVPQCISACTPALLHCSRRFFLPRLKV